MEFISRTKPGRRLEAMVKRLWGFYKVDYPQFRVMKWSLRRLSRSIIIIEAQFERGYGACIVGWF
jgi:hypothetical protein